MNKKEVLRKNLKKAIRKVEILTTKPRNVLKLHKYDIIELQQDQYVTDDFSKWVKVPRFIRYQSYRYYFFLSNKEHLPYYMIEELCCSPWRYFLPKRVVEKFNSIVNY